MFTATAGEIPFAEVTGVDTRARRDRDEDNRRARPAYRLVLTTRSGDVYLSAIDSRARSDFDGLATAIRGVLAGSPAARGPASA
jgi:hypothetical protein